MRKAGNIIKLYYDKIEGERSNIRGSNWERVL